MSSKGQSDFTIPKGSITDVIICATLGIQKPEEIKFTNVQAALRCKHTCDLWLNDDESRFSTTAVNLLHAIYQGISRCLHYANFTSDTRFKAYLDCSLSIGALEIAKKKMQQHSKGSITANEIGVSRFRDLPVVLPSPIHSAANTSQSHKRKFKHEEQKEDHLAQDDSAEPKAKQQKAEDNRSDQKPFATTETLKFQNGLARLARGESLEMDGQEQTADFDSARSDSPSTFSPNTDPDKSTDSSDSSPELNPYFPNAGESSDFLLCDTPTSPLLRLI